MANEHYKYITIGIDQLKPYENNARTHSASQVKQIQASIEEFGFTNPLLIDGENNLIAGHGRLEAAQGLGVKELPCIIVDGLTDAQKRALVISDNQLALNAGWDVGLLKAGILDLQENDFDLELLGFDDDFLNELLEDADEDIEGLTDEDEAPEEPEEPISKPGDIWVCGNHRVMCGDSTSVDDVDKLMGGEKWDVCIFDPPYEIGDLYGCIPVFEPGKKLIVFWDFKRFAKAGYSAMCAGWEGLYEFVWDNCTSWYTPNRPLARHKACGVFGDDPYFNFDDAIIHDGKKIEAKKVSNTRGDCDYVPLDGAVHIRTVEQFPTTQESGGHAHSKPIKWINAIYKGVGGSIYLDMFGGSGSTIIAAQKIGVNSYTMELEPKYVDVIVKRWENFTGEKAELIENN